VSIVVFIIVLAFVGLIVGGLGRLLLPGPDPMTIPQTIMIGIVASYAAGLFSWYVLHRHGGGLVLSVLFAMLAVWLVRRYRRSTWSQGGPPGPRGRA
jgi:uncharacterized membrane protein YeaQ/YmgE (transglycosylase-associated protein family)